MSKDKCDKDVYKYGVVFSTEEHLNDPEKTCKNLSKKDNVYRYDWYYSAGRIVIKRLKRDFVPKEKQIENLKKENEDLEAKVKALEGQSKKLAQMILKDKIIS